MEDISGTPALVSRRPGQQSRCSGGHASNAARKAVVQGAWTEDHLYADGLAPSPVCKACEQATGTRRHRYYECGAFRAQRWERLPDKTWLHAAQSSGDDWLWTRGLAKDPIGDMGLHPDPRLRL